jgi:F-type H+-transporting ATPase subunit delta
MAELATLARPYAEAFFAATQGHSQADLDWLNAVATVAADAQVKALADNPRVTDEQVFEVVQTAAKAAASDKAANFLRLVIENGRLDVLPTIAAQVRTLVNAAQGVNEAIVQSAFELSDESLNDLAATLEKRFGRSLKLTVALAPELIGGVRVVVGDEVFDTSVKARLEQMKSALLA